MVNPISEATSLDCSLPGRPTIAMPATHTGQCTFGHRSAGDATANRSLLPNTEMLRTLGPGAHRGKESIVQQLRQPVQAVPELHVEAEQASPHGGAGVDAAQHRHVPEENGLRGEHLLQTNHRPAQAVCICRCRFRVKGQE